MPSRRPGCCSSNTWTTWRASARCPSLDWRGQYPHLAAFHDGLLEGASFRDTQPVALTMEAGVV